MGSVFTTSKNVKAKSAFGVKSVIPFYLQFVPGVVVESITHPDVINSYNEISNVNSIIAAPHITDSKTVKKRKGQLSDSNRYFPLLRGIFEVPAKGDPVLLCTIAGKQYYLGPLNTDNHPNWNKDNLYQTERAVGKNKNILKNNERLSRGESLNFKKKDYHRLAKKPQSDLDESTSINEVHGDIMLEGRHGNSIRIGSRNVNPYIFISNDRGGQYNIQETLADGSLISITNRGTLAQHFGSYKKIISEKPQGGNNEGFLEREIEEVFGFTLASDTIESPNRLLGKLVSSVNGNQDAKQLVYDYGVNEKENQLFMQSDRITLNSKRDDIYLSSIKDIHIGTGRHLTISTNKDLVVESERTFLGNPNVEGAEMEPMVLGNVLLEVLQDILGLLKEAQGVCTGAPIPLVDLTASPLSAPGGKIATIEQKLNNIISGKHFIEK